MSTIITLVAHEGTNPPRLRRFVPRLLGHEKERRKMTLTPELYDWLMAPAASEQLNRVKAQIRTHLGQFVKGLRVDDCLFMKRVEDRRRRPSDFSHEVWSISPRFGSPQHRLFGTFVTQDWFLLCTKQSRDRLDEHDNRWHAEIDMTLRVWKHFFGTCRQHSGTQLRDYIALNADHCDDRW